MDKTKKKSFRGLLLALAAALAMLFVPSVAGAANQPYVFSLGNTGQTYNVYTATSNKKVYTDRGWVLYVDNISNAQGYGVNCRLFYKSSGSYYRGSNGHWRKTTGRTVGSFAQNQAVKNRSYYIGARIDDDYYGTTDLDGRYNSDT